MVAAVTTPASTPSATWKSPVTSSTSKTMVNGAPTIEAATAPMPTSMNSVRCSAPQEVNNATMSANVAPNRQPMKSDELNRPPRKPAPMEMAEPKALATSSAATTSSPGGSENNP